MVGIRSGCIRESLGFGSQGGHLYTLICFSPTGNALHLAGRLAERLDPSGARVFALESITDRPPGGEHLVLLYPIHAFNAPRNVMRFARRLPAGLYRTVSLIGVGCTTTWVNEAASSNLRRIFRKKGMPVVLDEILAMPLTIFTSFPEKVAGQVIADSETRIEEIAIAIGAGEPTTVKVSGWSRLLSFLGRAEPLASRLFGLELHASSACNACGICWENCPEKNIRRHGDGRPRFGFDCLMCLRCIYHCPQQAISPRFSKFIPISNGYSLSRYLAEREMPTVRAVREEGA
jgi:ferredoxin